jgi:hypothetical protein
MSTKMSSVPTHKKKTNLGAGLNVAKQNIENHPAGPPRHGELSQAERAFTLASTFLSGVLACVHFMPVTSRKFELTAVQYQCFAVPGSSPETNRPGIL